MLISLKNNIAVLAMTKTGSTSIEAKLAPFCDMVFTQDPRVKHIQLKRFDRFFRPYLETLGFKDIETTCVFREPLDWLSSWYRYRQRDQLKGHPNSTAGLSFEEFVLNYLSDSPNPYAKVGRQSKFVTDKNGKVSIDHLFRYDEFQQYENFLSQRFGKKLSFEKLNVSPIAQIDLPSSTRSKLEQKLGTDFEIYEGLNRD